MHNLHTSYTFYYENTNYFFEVEHEYLEPVLDRLSRFFINPLFDADSIVSIENQKNLSVCHMTNFFY